MRQQFGHIDLLFMPSEICDNGNRTEVLVWEVFLIVFHFFLSSNFQQLEHIQTYVMLVEPKLTQLNVTKLWQ